MDLKNLAKRYKISEQKLQVRFAYAGVDPDHIDEEAIDRLDSINQHLAEGQPLNSFKYTPAAQVTVIDEEVLTIEKSEPSSIAAPIEIQDFEALERIYAFLQKAADNEWHLPTSIVRGLTGSTPRGKCWKRFGFEFTPATKHGVEKAWAVQSASWDFPING